MPPRLNPHCRRPDEIHYPTPPSRGLAPIEGMFSGSSTYLDRATRPRRVAARSRVGSPTPAAQQIIQRTDRECPWQLFQDPETGQTHIERRYRPEDEPLHPEY